MTALVSKKIFAFLNVCTIHGQNILDVYFYSFEISKWLPLSNMATAVVSLIITWITQICRLRQFNGFEHSEYTVNNYVFLENRFIILENKMAASCPRWLLTVVTNKVLHAIVYGLWCSWCHCCALRFIDTIRIFSWDENKVQNAQYFCLLEYSRYHGDGIFWVVSLVLTTISTELVN